LSSLSFLFTAHAVRAQAPRAEPLGGVPVLLCVFLRGAADGLNVIVPHADAEYYRLRPTIAVPRPGERWGALDLDGRFGLHPKLEPLKAAYDAGELALVHAVGSPHPTRSHFAAQDYMTTGAVGDRTVAQGWLARYLATRPSAESGLLRAVALSSRPPLALRGHPDAIVTPRLRDFRFAADEALEPLLSKGFARLYRGESSSPAERAGQRALEASRLVQRALASQKNAAKYARDVQEFAEVARLIKADVGLQTAWIDLGGWDTHRRQGSAQTGDLPRQLDRLGRALGALRADLGPLFERVVVVVMSEFGRTVRENGSGGTDHGHGGAMLVLGGKVKGRRVLGAFPGLSPDQLFEGRDLAVTTDFRDVLCEVCEGHLGMPDSSGLFQGFRRDKARRLGLFG
jgi:uncharacterized protein (DUF1501 family)